MIDISSPVIIQAKGVLSISIVKACDSFIVSNCQNWTEIDLLKILLWKFRLINIKCMEQSRSILEFRHYWNIKSGKLSSVSCIYLISPRLKYFRFDFWTLQLGRLQMEKFGKHILKARFLIHVLSILALFVSTSNVINLKPFSVQLWCPPVVFSSFYDISVVSGGHLWNISNTAAMRNIDVVERESVQVLW